MKRIKAILAAVLAVFMICAPVFDIYVFANYAGESFFIPWEFELFEEATFRSEVLGRSSQRRISVLQNAGDWAMTEIDGYVGWVNLRYSPAMCALDAFFVPLGRDVAVFYMNLDTGFTYVHNSERVLFGASLSKLTHAFYTFQLAERGVIDMYEVHVYSPADEWGGTGILRFEPFGQELTTRELLALSIRESDNAAFRMLERFTRNAEPSYRDFVREIGADTRMIRDVLSQNTHANDMGLFMYEIWRYIQGESRYGHYFWYDLLNTANTSHPYFTRWEGSNGLGDQGVGTMVNVRMLVSDYPLARKYGWANNSFHDAGIIHAPSPYILVVLTNSTRGAHGLMADVSWFMQDFNHATFVAPVPLNSTPKGPERYSGQSASLMQQSAQQKIALLF
ncbi:MAG: class A beta-lactamase-related serine hydrolase [Defluviitaleaceae bacterium]|nr:class A beta-lactamase-related serine hydrolase [Defluviitaleaceae bacterium]